MTPPLKKELEIALDLARQAGVKAVEMSRTQVAVREKADDQGPVTEADEAANTIIVEGLSAIFPDDSIIAEESPNAFKKEAPRTWFVDPIDGTKEYVRGLQGKGSNPPEWSVMIGLAVSLRDGHWPAAVHGRR